MPDRRRAQWVPLSVNVGHGKTGTQLMERFGNDGLLVWVLYLTACKRAWVQGTFDYTSEPDGWAQLARLGVFARPAFTLDEFFKYTGQLKQTRRTRSGGVLYVTCTQWEDWNKTAKRQLDAEKKSRKRADITAPIRGTESESESESEREIRDGPRAARAPRPKALKLIPDEPRPRQRDEVWDVLVELFGEPQTATERSGRGKVVKELHAVNATAADVRVRVKQMWALGWDAPSTHALTKHWTQLGMNGHHPGNETPAQRIERARAEGRLH